MDISFVILTWNSEKYIDLCLKSVFSSLAGQDLVYEVLVVDNGSSDRSREILGEYSLAKPETVKPIYLEQNRGTTVSRNLALDKAQGKYICIMDSDVELNAGVFGPLLEKLNSDPSIGLVVPKLLYPSGKWQKSIDRFPTLLHKLNRFFRLRAIEGQEGAVESKLTESREVDYAISAFWLFKRDILARVGKLDEKIFYAPEDVDYCLRIWKSGYKIEYVPGSTVVHHTQEISRGWKINKAKIEHLKGLVYLYAKHGYCFCSPKIGSA